MIAPTQNVSSGKDPFAVGFARRLRATMIEGHIASAARLAELMEVQPSRARNWCNGTSVPTVKEALHICELTGVTLDWLFDERTAGLTEGKRIRLMLVLSDMELPLYLPTAAVVAEAASDRAEATTRPRQSQRRVRRRVKGLDNERASALSAGSPKRLV